MKLNIFYSWQSDLPNKTNRQFIKNCLDAAMNDIHANNKIISDWSIESDSRGEIGTPELASRIFAKIDQCDIFVADISIINPNIDFRKTSNPNVLIELGYASSKLGWDRILCIHNLMYGKIEDLPFDIRHRKPIAYTPESKTLTKNLIYQIQEIIDNRISNKKYYTSIKREIDNSLQAILIDTIKLLFFGERPKCYDYNLILHMTRDELLKELFEKELLGFQLFKDNNQNLHEFVSLYNNQVYLNFLGEKEKYSLAKILLQFKDFLRIINDHSIYNKKEITTDYDIVNANQINENNPQNSYILLKKIDEQKRVVMDSGTFHKKQLSNLLYLYRIKSDAIETVIEKILDLALEINEWIRISGNYFMINDRLLSETK